MFGFRGALGRSNGAPRHFGLA